jgi:hypothetical protein
MVRVRENVRGVESGKTFGNRVVLGCPFSRGSVGEHGPNWSVVVKCRCGRIAVVTCDELVRQGELAACVSCSNSRAKRKHGEAVHGKVSKLYKIWNGMRQRCYDENNIGWLDYGGRGISMCKEWDDFIVFRDWALANGYEDGLEIDRFPNNDGNYEPGNCRWVTHTRNQRNKRTSRIVAAFGESKCVADWLDDARCVVKRTILYSRIRRGWEPEKAITCP